jgi:hypothetical protein
VVIKSIKRSKESLTLHSTALKFYHGQVPVREGTVRITEYEETWILQPAGSRTFAVYRAKAEPEGVFPKTLINYMMHVAALKTVQNFKTMVKYYVK